MSTIVKSHDKANPLRGHFSLRVLDREGLVIESFEDPNMIVDLARVAMAHLVGEGEGLKVITRFGVGVGAQTASPGDTELTEAYVNDILAHDYPDKGTVRFSWRLGYDEANGKSITEFGLYCADGTLFSRKVRSPIYKASDIAFEGEWSIIF